MADGQVIDSSRATMICETDSNLLQLAFNTARSVWLPSSREASEKKLYGIIFDGTSFHRSGFLSTLSVNRTHAIATAVVRGAAIVVQQRESTPLRSLQMAGMGHSSNQGHSDCGHRILLTSPYRRSSLFAVRLRLAHTVARALVRGTPNVVQWRDPTTLCCLPMAGMGDSRDESNSSEGRSARGQHHTLEMSRDHVVLLFLHDKPAHLDAC